MVPPAVAGLASGILAAQLGIFVWHHDSSFAGVLTGAAVMFVSWLNFASGRP